MEAFFIKRLSNRIDVLSHLLCGSFEKRKKGISRAFLMLFHCRLGVVKSRHGDTPAPMVVRGVHGLFADLLSQASRT